MRPYKFVISLLCAGATALVAPTTAGATSTQSSGDTNECADNPNACDDSNGSTGRPGNDGLSPVLAQYFPDDSRSPHDASPSTFSKRFVQYYPFPGPSIAYYCCTQLGRLGPVQFPGPYGGSCVWYFPYSASVFGYMC